MERSVENVERKARCFPQAAYCFNSRPYVSRLPCCSRSLPSPPGYTFGLLVVRVIKPGLPRLSPDAVPNKLRGLVVAAEMADDVADDQAAKDAMRVGEQRRGLLEGVDSQIVSGARTQLAAGSLPCLHATGTVVEATRYPAPESVGLRSPQ